MRSIALLVLLSVVASAPASAQTTYIRDVRVFDGTRVHDRTNVLVRAGVIAAIGADVRAPADATIVAGAGHTLLPGLIDAHTHVFGDMLQDALVFGVTTALDMFTDHNALRTWKQEQRDGRATQRADVFSAGTLVTAPGGHGTQFGMTIPTITDAAEAQAFVDARIAEGSDWIKIVYDDGRAFDLPWQSLSQDVLHALVTAAHRRNRLAVVHVTTLAAARAALAAGADGLVHLFIDAAPTPELITLAKTRNTFVIPTLVMLKSATGTPGGAPLLDDARLQPYIGPQTRAMLTSSFPPARTPRLYEHAQHATAQLHRAGVRVLAGSDAPNPGTAHGIALHRELELLVEAGLTPVEALAAATRVPAQTFGLDDRGVIAVNRRADLVLVQGDPTTDITATRAITAVWKGGVRLDRDAVRARVAKEVAAANAPRAQIAAGPVADFEKGTTDAMFGTAWLPNTDSYAGGKSTVTLAIVPGGEGNSGHALRIAGIISNAVPYAWAGAMWSPGAQPMAPANLAATQGVSFATKGDGGTYRMLVFAQSRGYEPLSHEFVAPADWTAIVVPWRTFGVDGSDIMAVMFVGGPRPGAFTFQIDNVRLH